MAATCLPHSRVSLLSLFRPCSVGTNTLRACCFPWLSIRPESVLHAAGAGKVTKSEPALTRKTPLLSCSIRIEIPYPCVGSSARVFRMSMSRVPWTRSLDLSAIDAFLLEEYTSPTDCQEEERHDSTGKALAFIETNLEAYILDGSVQNAIQPGGINS